MRGFGIFVLFLSFLASVPSLMGLLHGPDPGTPTQVVYYWVSLYTIITFLLLLLGSLLVAKKVVFVIGVLIFYAVLGIVMRYLWNTSPEHAWPIFGYGGFVFTLTSLIVALIIVRPRKGQSYLNLPIGYGAFIKAIPADDMTPDTVKQRLHENSQDVEALKARFNYHYNALTWNNFPSAMSFAKQFERYEKHTAYLMQGVLYRVLAHASKKKEDRGSNLDAALGFFIKALQERPNQHHPSYALAHRAETLSVMGFLVDAENDINFAKRITPHDPTIRIIYDQIHQKIQAERNKQLRNERLLQAGQGFVQGSGESISDAARYIFSGNPNDVLHQHRKRRERDW
jgi:hypothetical protein